MTSSSDSSCPKCGAPIPEDAPQGLCPKCVFAGAATTPATSASSGKRTPPPSMEEIVAEFPELEIVELIGAGGMGAVYKACQPKLDRFVALKILSRDLSEDPAFAERFNREARVLARLSHPNIVAVFDFGTRGPFCYLLMEYVDGVNLRQAMHAGRFTPADTLALVQDICAALKFAHEEGILHRDIKPENVLIDARGRVKIADFGIAKLVGEGERDDYTLTVQGAVLGSPHYMAPEQIERPGEVDQRADIYSLGVVFYELLTGELPIGRFVPPSEKSSMDPRIDEIVMRALEKERQRRYQTADEVKTGVESITQSQAEGPEQAGGPPSFSEPRREASTSAPETARFATASAILTGVSFLLAGVTLLLVIPLLFTAAMSFQDLDTQDARGLWSTAAFSLFAGGLMLMAGVPALLGIIFGAKALGEIRQSGGRKGGYGSALFGALAWPELLVVVLPGVLLHQILDALGVGLPYPLFFLLVLALGLTSGIVLFRTVGRWAKGGGRVDRRIDRSDRGERSGWHPAVIALLVVMGVLIGVPVLLFLLYGGLSREPSKSGPSVPVEEQVDIVEPWPAGQPREKLWEQYWEDPPEILLNMIVPEGHAATIQLVRSGASGQESISNQWSAVASDLEPFDGVLAMGADLDLQEKQMDGVAALKATFWSLKDGPVVALDKFYEGELTLGYRQKWIDLRKGDPRRERDRIELGKLQPNGSSSIETLELRVLCEPRPGPGRPFVLKEERIGMGSPADLLADVIESEKQETP